MKWTPRTLRIGLNLFGPYLGAGVKVTHIASDWREVRVSMKLRWYNRKMLARNPWNMTFGSRVAFADLGGRQTAWTGDRREFLGRNGTLDNSAALAGEALLSQRVGAGLDQDAAGRPDASSAGG